MNDSVDRVIEEWELQSGGGVLHREGECSFVINYTARDFLVVAAWRRSGPEAVLLGYLGYLTPESDHGFQWREAEVKDLRAALGLPAWVAPPAPWSDDSELGRVERAEDAEGALTIRLNPKAAESIPGTDWQVDSPGQYSSHPNAQAAWIEAGILLGVLDDGEGVAGLTRELLTRVEQIEALLVKRAQELDEARQQAASLKRESDAARLRVGELEWEVGRMETELSIERDAARREIEWLKRAWAACRRVICEMSDVQAAREELADATRRLSAAQAERHEAEREPDDQW